MAFTSTSAGVYDQDRDLSVRGGPIISSICAAVIESARGPTNEWVFVTDEQDLLDNFGVKNYTKYGYGMHCATHTLAQTAMWIKRAVNAATARTAGAYLSVDDVEALDPIIKLVNFDDGTNKPQGVLGNPLEVLGFPINEPGVTNAMLYVCANSPGNWSDILTIRFRPSNQQGTEVGEFSNPNHFYIDVFLNYQGSASVPVESYLCSRSQELDGEGNQMFVESRVNSFSKYIKVKNNENCPIVQVRHTVFERLYGGDDGARPTETEVINAWAGIDDTEEYAIQILVGCGYESPAIHRRMDAVAVARGDATAILDFPHAMSEVARAVNWRRNTLNLSSSYSALYGPRAKILDDVSNKYIWCPISGLVAAQYAYNDKNRAYYWAPAGLNRGQVKVAGIYKQYNLRERNALEQAQINYVRKIPRRGYFIMEQMTLQTFASGFSNVNVRRLVNGIKAMVRRAFLPSVFNPADDYERRQLKNIVDAEAATVKRGRGLYDWETICDARNNPPSVVANNDIVLDFVIDPSIPAKRASLTADIRNFGSSISFQEN